MPLREWPRVPVIRCFFFRSKRKNPVNRFGAASIEVVSQIVLRSGGFLVAVDQPVLLSRDLPECRRAWNGLQRKMQIRKRFIVAIDDLRSHQFVSGSLRKINTQQFSRLAALRVAIDDSRAPVRPFLSITASADSNRPIKFPGVSCNLDL